MDAADPTKRHTRISLRTTPRSIGASPDFGFLVGTNDGVYAIGSDGAARKHFGNGPFRVHATGGPLFVSDSHGVVYSKTEKRWRVFLAAEILDVTKWKGELCVLARFGDGGRWVGVIDRKARIGCLWICPPFRARSRCSATKTICMSLGRVQCLRLRREFLSAALTERFSWRA